MPSVHVTVLCPSDLNRTGKLNRADGLGHFHFYSIRKGHNEITGRFRARYLYDTISLSQFQKKAFQIFHNINGSMRAVNDQGVIIIQTKKLKGKSREIARIDTRNQEVTIGLAIDDVPE